MAQSALKTRVITGFIFGCVLIGGILWNEYSFLSLLAIILVAGNFELQQLLSKLQVFPNKLFSNLSNVCFLLLCFYFGFLNRGSAIDSGDFLSIGALFILLFLAMAFAELFRTRPKPFENAAAAVFSLFYLGLPAGLLLLSAIDQSSKYHPGLVLFFFFFIWASDVGAYFTGRAFGKHKLFERHSPNKTIEGFIGGIIASALVGLAAYRFLGILSVPVWMCMGALLSVAGTGGDLFESMLKRQAHVKDSGQLLPGHGGILDRFDSTFIAAPVYFLLLRFLN
jgi:phosphatidate cytidylyltransferase